MAEGRGLTCAELVEAGTFASGLLAEFMVLIKPDYSNNRQL
jgi:hypothetical protein